MSCTRFTGHIVQNRMLQFLHIDISFYKFADYFPKQIDLHLQDILSHKYYVPKGFFGGEGKKNEGMRL